MTIKNAEVVEEILGDDFHLQEWEEVKTVQNKFKKCLYLEIQEKGKRSHKGNI